MLLQGGVGVRGACVGGGGRQADQHLPQPLTRLALWRSPAVDADQDKAFVFLLSTRAGGQVSARLRVHLR